MTDKKGNGKPPLVDAEFTAGLSADRAYLAASLLGSKDVALAVLREGEALLMIIEGGVGVAKSMLTEKALAGLPADKLAFWFGQAEAPTSEAALMRGYVLRGLFDSFQEAGVEDEAACKVMAAWSAIIVSENLDPTEATTALVEDVITW